MRGDDSKEDAQFDADALQLTERLPKLQEWAASRCLSGRTTERAFIVEFAGMPKAGKSLAIETLRHFFSHGTKLIVGVSGELERKYREGYIVHTPAEGVSQRTPNYLKPNLWHFNVWAGAYALQELLQASHDRYHDLVILDRGPWDAGCWLQYVRECRPGDVHPPENAEKVVEFFQLPHWATLSDLHVVLTVAPDDAKKRERTQRLIEHGGTASDPELMAKMREIYTTRFTSLESLKMEHCGAVSPAAARRIDTTGRRPKAIAVEIIRATLDLVEAKLANMPSKQPITMEELAELLKPCLVNATAPLRRKFDSYAPRFLDRSNRLSEKRRQLVRGRLTDLVWGVPAILNIVRVDEFRQMQAALEEILQEAEEE